MIVEKIKQNINNTLKKLNYPIVDYSVDLSKFVKFGDFNTNVAMVLKKDANFKDINPMQLAENIVKNLDQSIFQKIEIAKPGFINFTLSDKQTFELFKIIDEEKNLFPLFDKKNEIASVEFVSANPTGFLHIGHARNAALGEAISRLLEKIGYKVIRDYVVNDAGNQMNILASSVLIRYLQKLGKNIELPDDSYHGEEIKLVAQSLYDKFSNKFENIKPNNNFYIENDEIRNEIRDFARNYLLNKISNDLNQLGVKMDEYFSELTTHKNPERIEKIIKNLGDNVYKKEGALWFKSTNFGDDKDRVLIKSNGDMTYFLPDIYYHNYKLTRNKNTTKAVIILGSDHYSYFDRVKAVLLALGHKDIHKKYFVVFMQMVKLMKNGSEYKMSKRSGQSLTLIDLVNALGKNIANWYLISANPNIHLEIDIDVALNKNENNIFYYITSAFYRAKNLLNKTNFKFDSTIKYPNLNSDLERLIINQIHFLKQTIFIAANSFDPQKIVNFIINLARLFQQYYEKFKIINEDDTALTQQRLTLVYAVAIVLNNLFKLLNIELND